MVNTAYLLQLKKSPHLPLIFPVGASIDHFWGGG